MLFLILPSKHSYHSHPGCRWAFFQFYWFQIQFEDERIKRTRILLSTVFMFVGSFHIKFCFHNWIWFYWLISRLLAFLNKNHVHFRAKCPYSKIETLNSCRFRATSTRKLLIQVNVLNGHTLAHAHVCRVECEFWIQCVVQKLAQWHSLTSMWIFTTFQWHEMCCFHTATLFSSAFVLGYKNMNVSIKRSRICAAKTREAGKKEQFLFS